MFWRSTPVALALIVLLPHSHTGATPGAQTVHQVPSDAEAIKLGLIAWQKPDGYGRSCISCHSPQGLELAFYAFPDKDIQRRAEAHVSPAEGQQIVDMIHARRRQYNLTKLRDPMNDRPLQPGGAVLPGATPEARDIAFEAEIDKCLPLLTRGSVDSLAKARLAASQVIALDLTRLPVGLEFNRLSEDGFHGPEHALLAHWIPDTPVKLPPAAIEARDAYLQDPTDDNLTAFVSQIPVIAARTSLADQLSLVKYRSLVRLQAFLAHPEQNPLRPRMHDDNPFWDVADLARNIRGFPIEQLGLPADIRAKKEPGPSLIRQFQSMELPWYWMGFMADPGIQHVGLNRKSRRAQYFGFELFELGPYPMHEAFMILRKQLAQSLDPKAWNSASPQHFVLEYTAFLLNQNFLRFEPKEPKADAMYRRFVANEFRTSLYLLWDETRKSHLTDIKNPELAEARQIADFVESQDPKFKPTAEALLTKIEIEFAKSEQVRGVGY